MVDVLEVEGIESLSFDDMEGQNVVIVDWRELLR